MAIAVVVIGIKGSTWKLQRCFMSRLLLVNMAMWHVGLSRRILGMVLEHIFSIGPWHVIKSAVVISRNSDSLSFAARNFTSESSKVTPVEFVSSVLIGTGVLTIW